MLSRDSDGCVEDPMVVAFDRWSAQEWKDVEGRLQGRRLLTWSGQGKLRFGLELEPPSGPQTFHWLTAAPWGLILGAQKIVQGFAWLEQQWRDSAGRGGRLFQLKHSGTSGWQSADSESATKRSVEVLWFAGTIPV